MAERGKKSVASLQVATVGVDRRLQPPGNLTALEKATWMEIVNSMPAEWIGAEQTGLLTQYCRHRVQADIVAGQIKIFDPEWLMDDEGLKRYDKLLAIQDRETKSLNLLARSMRLTNQSHYRADKVVKGKSTQKKPWER